MFGGKAHTATATLPWLLAFAGFIIAMAGVATMQQQCGASSANTVTNVGSTDYLSPVTCDRFFSMDWFIVFWHFFVWLLVGAFLFSRGVHRWRHSLVTLLAIACVLLIFFTNVWFRPWAGLFGGNNLTSKFIRGSKVAFSGGIISAFANMLLLMILGLHDEKVHGGGSGVRRDTDPCPPGYVPAGTATTTTTTTAAETRPVASTVTSVREGPLGGVARTTTTTTTTV